MPVYFISGKLGAGKGLSSADRIREAFYDGRRVATNMDLYLENMLAEDSKQSATRIPDKPRLEDLKMLGRGYEGDDVDESKNGLLVLDECASWLNSRAWNDKERAPVIEWFLHARKHRWDIIFQVQRPDSIDTQLYEALCEHLVIVNRLDRLRFAKVIKMPRMHIAHVYYGTTVTAGIKVETWTTRGTDLFSAYDTEQCFTDGREVMGGEFVDMRAPYTMLSAWHLKGRYKEEVMEYRNPLWFRALVGMASFVNSLLPKQEKAPMKKHPGHLGFHRDTTPAPKPWKNESPKDVGRHHADPETTDIHSSPYIDIVRGSAA